MFSVWVLSLGRYLLLSAFEVSLDFEVFSDLEDLFSGILEFSDFGIVLVTSTLWLSENFLSDSSNVAKPS